MEVLSVVIHVTFVYLLFSVHPLQQKNSSTACAAHNSIAPERSSSKDPNYVAVPKDLPIGNHWRNHKGRPGDHTLRVFLWQVELVHHTQQIYHHIFVKLQLNRLEVRFLLDVTSLSSVPLTHPTADLCQ